jgi:large subunit ribosomal protein L17
MHKRISTTVPKAKQLRRYVEPLITRSKDDRTHSRRVVFSYLQNKEAVAELFRGVSEKIADRPGGYTRILKTGFRKGDAAEMCIIELVDYNEGMLATKKETRKTTGTRRSRRGSGAKKAETTAQATPDSPTNDIIEDAVIVEKNSEDTAAEDAQAAESEGK